jgi:Fe-S-cluster containining protein
MPWYKEGLQFQCTGCGECCTGEPGYVWLSSEEIDTIAEHLNLSREDFLKKYTRKIFGKISLIEDRINYDCVFLKDRRCQIYSARPLQCRTFPWWEENLETPASWKEVGRRCEGVNHPDAPIVPLDTIELEKNK